ncbi:MAG TPA: tRNA (adenosine(37)-N6)-threonylcarbamoyltransferase complex dimerization subunit type 1 TsaB [Terracidiphilus sp.]|nr:tRNA (adenosine(37)-N6)-threonylcarbamoyltransferase complex dimerization subunit type 1 TsaB [Terracidiphilus sp.]
MAFWVGMRIGGSTASAQRATEGLLLGIDTCGPSGSVALGRLAAGRLEIPGEKGLASRSYSVTLVAAAGELLQEAGVRVRDLAAMVVVKGPGSFTGVRVGLGAVKGLAEPGRTPVIAVSRLAVLAEKAGVDSAALDAHRHEVFLRWAAGSADVRELLAGNDELTGLRNRPERIAVCEEAAAALLSEAWPKAELIRVEPPTARDAIQMAVRHFTAGEFVDVALLDGHYLRRSDAEIFGEARSTVGRK